MKKQKTPPKYISLGTTTMRYRVKENDYYRDAGYWRVNYKYLDDKLVADCEVIPYLHEIELKPITIEEWKKDNQGYL